MKASKEITENIAFSISAEEHVPIYFNSNVSPEEQERVMDYVNGQDWNVEEVSVRCHPAAALRTVVAYEITVPIDIWREWRTKGVEACFREMLDE